MDNERMETIREKQQEIINLMSDLTSPVSEIGDYKIIKCYEASISGQKTMPYDLPSLLEKRQEVRDKINELQAEVESLQAVAENE